MQWTEFPFGPPLLEAINVGSIDLGTVGEHRRSSRKLRAPTSSTSPMSRRPRPRRDSGAEGFAPEDGGRSKGQEGRVCQGSNVNYFVVKVLERAGLLNKRRSGREQLASGDVEAVRSVASMLDELESVWRGRVARIDALLMEEN